MDSTAAPRIRPRIRLGLVALAVYLVVVYGIWIATGVDYLRIGENADTLLKWYVAPLLGGSVALIVVVSIFGWWRPSLFEDRRRLGGWVWIFPGLLVLAAVVGVLVGDTSRITGVMWLYLVIGSVLVGFNEELATRGQLIVALRSRFGESGVWFFSTLAFSLIHLPNVLFGTGAAGLLQLVTTFLLGSAFYLARRVAGTLLAAMLVHAVWDFSNFAAPGALTAVVGGVVGVASVVVAVILTRREGRQRT